MVFFLSADGLHVARWQKVQVVWQQQRQQPRGSRPAIRFVLGLRGFLCICCGVLRRNCGLQVPWFKNSLPGRKDSKKPTDLKVPDKPEIAQKHMAQTLAAGKFNDTKSPMSRGPLITGKIGHFGIWSSIFWKCTCVWKTRWSVAKNLPKGM